MHGQVQRRGECQSDDRCNRCDTTMTVVWTLSPAALPEMDGLQATQIIRALPGWQDTAVIALTANAFDDSRRACEAPGMNDAGVRRPASGVKSRKVELAQQSFRCNTRATSEAVGQSPTHVALAWALQRVRLRKRIAKYAKRWAETAAMTKARYVLPSRFDLVGRKLRFPSIKPSSAAGTGVQALHQPETPSLNHLFPGNLHRQLADFWPQTGGAWCAPET